MKALKKSVSTFVLLCVSVSLSLSLSLSVCLSVSSFLFSLYCPIIPGGILLDKICHFHEASLRTRTLGRGSTVLLIEEVNPAGHRRHR